jgi:hypothetical protein
MYFGEEYAVTHIRTVLSNYCEITGYHAKRGQQTARFARVSRGRYRVL